MTSKKNCYLFPCAIGYIYFLICAIWYRGVYKSGWRKSMDQPKALTKNERYKFNMQGLTQAKKMQGLTQSKKSTPQSKKHVLIFLFLNLSLTQTNFHIVFRKMNKLSLKDIMENIYIYSKEVYFQNIDYILLGYMLYIYYT